MPVGVNVAADAAEYGVVSRNRAVQTDAQDLALVPVEVPGPDILRGRQFLRADGCAVERELVVPLIPNRQVQLLVETKNKPSREVIVTGGQVVQDVCGTAEDLRAWIVGIASNRETTDFRLSGVHVVRQDDIHEIRASVPEQIRV
jgi:hypothetical protein